MFRLPPDNYYDCRKAKVTSTCQSHKKTYHNKKGGAKPVKKRTRKPKQPLFIVGIGSSAGGLEALSELVSKLPTNAPLGYVVVQHMAPQYRSMMVELLARETKVKIVGIKNRTKVAANTIHITPPNHDVEIRNGVL